LAMEMKDVWSQVLLFSKGHASVAVGDPEAPHGRSGFGTAFACESSSMPPFGAWLLCIIPNTINKKACSTRINRGSAEYCGAHPESPDRGSAGPRLGSVRSKVSPTSARWKRWVCAASHDAVASRQVQDYDGIRLRGSGKPSSIWKMPLSFTSNQGKR